MRTIHRLELEQNVQENQYMNFLAFVQTPWHALGVNAFIKMKENEGMHLSGFVCILRHAQAGVILGADSFSFCNSDIEIVFFTDGVKENLFTKVRSNLRISKTLKSTCSTGTDFYILSTVYPKYQWHAFLTENCAGKRPVSVMIDEGLGMYMRTTHDWIMEMWSSKDRFYKKLKYTYEFCLGSPKKDKMLLAKNEYISFGLFNRTEMTINFKTVEYYKKVLLDKNRSFMNSDLSCYENALVINTQPYYDEGQIKNDNDIALIREVCHLCAGKGISVVLKPHPREEDITRYAGIDNCIIDSNFSVSQEVIISSLKVKPRLVVGLCSTTLVSLQFFYGIKTVSLLNCINENGIGKKMRNDLMRFKAVFGKTIDCPSNMVEFSSYLCEIQE